MKNILVEYVRTHVRYRDNQAEYVIHIRVIAPQGYVKICSTRRVLTGCDSGERDVFDPSVVYLYSSIALQISQSICIWS